MLSRNRLVTGWVAALLAGGAALSACTSADPRPAPSTAPSPTRNLLIPSPFPTPALSGLPKCDFPEEIEMPEWVPDDLPFPEGTYASETLDTSFGYNRMILVVPGSLVELARFVLTEWPKQGWVLGRGESEPGEIEDQFAKPPAVGAFKAQEQYCAPGYSLMLVIYAPDQSQIHAEPTTQGGSPIAPTPTPTPSPTG